MSFSECGEGDGFQELSQLAGSRAPSVVFLSHQGRAGPAETPPRCVHPHPPLLSGSVLLILDSIPSRFSSMWDVVLERTEAGQSERGSLQSLPCAQSCSQTSPCASMRPPGCCWFISIGCPAPSFRLLPNRLGSTQLRGCRWSLPLWHFDSHGSILLPSLWQTFV